MRGLQEAVFTWPLTIFPRGTEAEKVKFDAYMQQRKLEEDEYRATRIYKFLVFVGLIRERKRK